MDEVEEALRRGDGFILRRQKRRKGKRTRAKAPVLSESLALLGELVVEEGLSGAGDVPEDALRNCLPAVSGKDRT